MGEDESLIDDYDDDGDDDDFEGDKDDEGQGQGPGSEAARLSENKNLPYISMDDDINLDEENVWPGRIEDTTPERKWYTRFGQYLKSKYTPVVNPLNKALEKIEKFLADVFAHDRCFKENHVFALWDSLINECVQHINIGINFISKFEPKVRLYERTTIDKNSPTHIAKIILYDIFAIDAVMTKRTRYGREAKKILDNWFENLHDLSFTTGLSLQKHITKCLDIFNKNNPSKKKMDERRDQPEPSDTQEPPDDEEDDYHPPSPYGQLPKQNEDPPKNTLSMDKILALIVKAVNKNRCDGIFLIIKKLNEYNKTEISNATKRKLKKKLVQYVNLFKEVDTNIKEIKTKLKKYQKLI